MFPFKHNKKLFYQFNLKKVKTADPAIYKFSRDISQSWQDIEYLVYILHFLFSRFNEEVYENEEEMIFNSLYTLSKSFYVHLDVIRNLLQKKIKPKVNLKLQCLINKNKKFWKKIAVARNNLILHKEKPDFIRGPMEMYGTDLDDLFSWEIIHKNKEGKIERIELRPLKDAEEVEGILKEFAQELNK